MSGPARTLALTICAAHPATGDDRQQLWVCGRKPGHDGSHIDVEELGLWPNTPEVTR